jgi:hypothetical protein
MGSGKGLKSGTGMEATNKNEQGESNMNYDELEKQQAYMRNQAQELKQGAVSGLNPIPINYPVRTSLRDRIAARVDRSQQELSVSARLQELQYLLDKNPDVARILDLLDIDIRL